MSSDDYSTPYWLKMLFEDWFDPCRLSDGDLREFDGLGEWKEKTYVNPPYSDPLPWVKKAIEENRKGKTVALLLKLDCSTEWFRLLMNARAHILFINERVKFNGKSPNFPNAIFILTGKDKSQETLFL